MADLAIVGVGRVGSLALTYLLEEKKYSVLAIDCVDRSNMLKKFSDRIVFAKACNPQEALEHVKHEKPRVVATALPSRIAGEYIEAFLKNGYNVVDVSFIDFDPYKYEGLCRRNNVYYVVDAGFAHGFSNLVIGWLYNQLGELDRVAIYVGGNPVKPEPPFYYEITWNAEDLIEEYTRPARIIRDYKVVEVDPLSEIMRVEIPGKGVYEAFYSDGLRTLIRNIRAREMFEATIRHPGHLGVVKILRDMGFLDKKPLKINSYEVAPAVFTAKLLEDKFKQKSRDEAVLYIEASKEDKYYKLLSVLEGVLGRSSIARYTALVFAKTIKITLETEIGTGIYPLEKLHNYYDEYLKYLEIHDIVLNMVTNI